MKAKELKTKILAEIERRLREYRDLAPDYYTYQTDSNVRELKELVGSINSLPEEPVSEDLKKAADNALESISDQYDIISVGSCLEMFRLGAKWQKEKEYTCYEEAFEDGAKWQKNHLWKSADGDDLPEYEQEVVVFTQNYPDDAGMMMVAIGHRPNPEGYDGKSLTTGEIEHYIPQTYGKGGWNIPDVKWWLDCSLPNMED